MLHVNKAAQRTPYPPELQSLMSVKTALEGQDWIGNWSGLHRGATPLYEMPGLARHLGVFQVYVKDESVRSPLGSFKALGAPLALARLILRLHSEKKFDPRGLFAGAYQEALRPLTVVSATDGNHGKGLAAAAMTMGCGCIIVLHANVSLEREQAIAQFGAKIVRIAGNYDESVAEAARLAQQNGWHVVSDTSYEGYEDVPRDVMQGYGIIAAELCEPDAPVFTHVFLQGGVGGLAAGISSYLWEKFGSQRPDFVVVEPEQADCLIQSAISGQPAKATGSVDSVMAGLACGETSPLAWRFLATTVDTFVTIHDEDAIAAMRLLAHGSYGDCPIEAGESGVAGLAGLLELMASPDAAKNAKLTSASRVLVINTEGATAPEMYRSLLGVSAAEVLERQREWKTAHLNVNASAG